MLAAEMVGFDWGLAEVGSRDHWIWHALRREAESVIVPDLPEFLEGRYEPRDNDERLCLLGACRFRNLTGASARLYAGAFAADSHLAEDLRTGLRYKAACAAASAGCGLGADAAAVDEAQRARWRRQAMEWLREDLAAWRGAGENGPDILRTLTRWQTDPELAGLRESDALTKLSVPEREQWTSFWAEVGAATQDPTAAPRFPTRPVSVR
jgi:serine/threonine-protein kinase